MHGRTKRRRVWTRLELPQAVIFVFFFFCVFSCDRDVTLPFRTVVSGVYACAVRVIRMFGGAALVRQGSSPLFPRQTALPCVCVNATQIG